MAAALLKQVQELRVPGLDQDGDNLDPLFLEIAAGSYMFNALNKNAYTSLASSIRFLVGLPPP